MEESHCQKLEAPGTVQEEVYIDPDTLNDAGILFVRSEDPVSWLNISVTKQTYSSMGFYYRTSASGVDRVQVVMVDVLRMIRPKWLDPGATLDDLIKSDLVSALAIKQLRPILDDKGNIDEEKTEELQECFRAAIAKVSCSGHEVSKREYIWQLFGHRVKCPTSSVTAVEMVNRVVELMGRSSDVPQQGGPSPDSTKLLEQPDEFGTNADGKIKVLTMLGATMQQQEVSNPNTANKLIQSYIRDNGLFGELQKLRLPKRNRIDIECAREDAIEVYQPFLSEVSSLFVDMLFHEQGFFETLVSGINQVKDISELDDVSTGRAMVGFSDDFRSIIKLINCSIKSGCLDYNELKKVTCKYLNDKAKAEISTGCSLGPNPLLPDLCKDIIINVQTGEKSGRKKFIGAVTGLRDHIAQLVDQVRCEEDTYVDINLLSCLVNRLVSTTAVPGGDIPNIDGEFSVEGSIVVTNDQGTKFPMQLSCGKRIVISTRNYDLSRFNKGELEEILCGLDYLADEDPLLEQLRTTITNILAESC